MNRRIRFPLRNCQMLMRYSNFDYYCFGQKKVFEISSLRQYNPKTNNQSQSLFRSSNKFTLKRDLTKPGKAPFSLKMSFDYRDEINRLIKLQKQQSFLRNNKHILNLHPQNKSQAQIQSSIVHQSNSLDSHKVSNNVHFMLQGNEFPQRTYEEADQYQPKGSRPKISSQKRINNPSSQSFISQPQNDINLKNIRNNSSYLGKSYYSSATQSPIKTIPNKSYMVKDILESQYVKSRQKTSEEQRKNTQEKEQSEYYEYLYDQNNNNSNQKYIPIYPKHVYLDTESGQLQYKSEGQENEPNHRNASYSPLRVNTYQGDLEKGQTLDNLQQYGVDEIQIKGGGGGMIKRKKKYDYRFRNVSELAQESENNASFGLVDMRQTPRLYEKKMKLQTINEWKNSRLISCEEDVLAKQDIDNAKFLNKRRLEEQIDMISRQQFQWEYVVSKQLHKHKVRNFSSANKKDCNLNEYRNVLFNNDFDKRIHSLYIDEKLLKFSAEKQNTEQYLRNHKAQLQKEKERIREQEMRTSKERLRSKQPQLSQLNSTLQSLTSADKKDYSFYKVSPFT